MLRLNGRLLCSVLLAATAFTARGGDDITGSSSSAGGTSQPSSVPTKSGKSIFEEPCGALTLEDVRTILPDATAGQQGTAGPDSGSCRWQSASKPAQAVVFLAVKLPKAQADAAKDGVSRVAGQTKVDVGEAGVFKKSVNVNLQYTGVTVKQDSVVALGKKLATRV